MTQLVARRHESKTRASWDLHVDGGACIGTVRDVSFGGFPPVAYACNTVDKAYGALCSTRNEAALDLARACGIMDAVPPEVWP